MMDREAATNAAMDDATVELDHTLLGGGNDDGLDAALGDGNHESFDGPGDDGDGTAESFAQIQTRRFRRGTSLPCWSLCPTMDLIAVGTKFVDEHHHDDGMGGSGGSGGGAGGAVRSGDVGPAESIAVHRLLSWQGLLALKSERLMSPPEDDDEEGGGMVCVEDIERRCRAADNDGEDEPSNETEGKGATAVCWSPDGRCLAVGLADGGVALHTVEPDAASAAESGGDGGDGHRPLHVLKPPPPSARHHNINLPSPSSGGGQRGTVAYSPRVTRSMAAARTGGGGGGSGATQPSSATRGAGRSRSRSRSHSPGKRRRGGAKFPNAVVGLAWRKWTPRAAADDKERERREAWRYGKGLVERGPHFLPPGTYPTNASAAAGGGSDGLNVLCVATRREIHWYLQGRYRMLSVSHGLGECASGMEVVCSPDLGAVLAVAKPHAAAGPLSPRKGKGLPKPRRAKLFSTHLLPQKRYELQLLSAAYTSIFTHLRHAQQGIEHSLSAWKSAVRPLDAKFKGLLQLLGKYQVDATKPAPGPESIRLEFLRFVLLGGSTVTSDTSGALDQFFTRATMHDQLLQREIRSVEAGAAAMETALRGGVLPCVRAAVYETGEVYGLAQAQGTTGAGEALLDPDVAWRLHASARVMYLTLERCLGGVIEARCRLKDLLAWMRGTASRVRARGTANDGPQKRNARDRRASDGVVRRVAEFLSGPMAFESGGNGDREYRTLTECVIGMPLSDFFVEGSVDGTAAGKENAPPPRGTKRVRSLASAVQSMFHLCTFLFDRPRGVFAQSLNELDISFDVEHSDMAIHTRIGAGPNVGSGGREDETSGFFCPRTAESDQSIEECSQWMLLARSMRASIDLIAMPGCNAGEAESTKGFCLRAHLRLPEGAEVSSIAFYGDNGLSSLSPGLGDDSEVKEGRQSLGCVVRVMDASTREVREELWVFPYDEVMFHRFDFQKSSKNEVAIPAAAFSDDECTFVTVSDAMGSTIVPKRRQLTADSQKQQTSQIDLCGSRGTCGVVAFGASTFLTIFDLEDDEDDDEDEDEAGSTGDDEVFDV